MSGAVLCFRKDGDRLASARKKEKEQSGRGRLWGAAFGLRHKEERKQFRRERSKDQGPTDVQGVWVHLEHSELGATGSERGRTAGQGDVASSGFYYRFNGKSRKDFKGGDDGISFM